MTVLVWLGIAVGCVLALVLLIAVLVLLVPVSVDAAWGDERRDVTVAVPGVRVAYDARTRTTELRLFSRRLGRWVSAGRERKPRPRRRGRRARRRLSLRRLWAERARVIAALRGFFRRLHFRRLSLDATLATPDPAVTGWVTGAAFAVRAVVPARVRAAVAFRPDFETEVPTLALDASVSLRPVHAAVLAIRLWRVTRAARKGPVPRKAAAAEGRRDSGNDRRDGGGREQP